MVICSTEETWKTCYKEILLELKGFGKEVCTHLDELIWEQFCRDEVGAPMLSAAIRLWHFEDMVVLGTQKGLRERVTVFSALFLCLLSQQDVQMLLPPQLSWLVSLRD